jgi:hypothetical protein
LIEKRLIDVFLRYGQQGVDAGVHTKWQQVFAIQRHFEQAINCCLVWWRRPLEGRFRAK